METEKVKVVCSVSDPCYMSLPTTLEAGEQQESIWFGVTGRGSELDSVPPFPLVTEECSHSIERSTLTHTGE